MVLGQFLNVLIIKWNKYFFFDQFGFSNLDLGKEKIVISLKNEMIFN